MRSLFCSFFMVGLLLGPIGASSATLGDWCRHLLSVRILGAPTFFDDIPDNQILWIHPKLSESKEGIFLGRRESVFGDLTVLTNETFVTLRLRNAIEHGAVRSFSLSPLFVTTLQRMKVAANPPGTHPPLWYTLKVPDYNPEGSFHREMLVPNSPFLMGTELQLGIRKSETESAEIFRRRVRIFLGLFFKLMDQ